MQLNNKIDLSNGRQIFNVTDAAKGALLAAFTTAATQMADSENKAIVVKQLPTESSVRAFAMTNMRVNGVNGVTLPLLNDAVSEISTKAVNFSTNRAFLVKKDGETVVPSRGVVPSNALLSKTISDIAEISIIGEAVTIRFFKATVATPTSLGDAIDVDGKVIYLVTPELDTAIHALVSSLYGLKSMYNLSAVRLTFSKLVLATGTTPLRHVFNAQILFNGISQTTGFAGLFSGRRFSNAHPVHYSAEPFRSIEVTPSVAMIPEELFRYTQESLLTALIQHIILQFDEDVVASLLDANEKAKHTLADHKLLVSKAIYGYAMHLASVTDAPIVSIT